jgi:hypothetical protein
LIFIAFVLKWRLYSYNATESNNMLSGLWSEGVESSDIYEGRQINMETAAGVEESLRINGMMERSVEMY